MRKSKFSETHIVGIFKGAESGVPVADLLGSKGSARRPSSSGAASTAAPPCPTSGGCVSSRPRTRTAPSRKHPRGWQQRTVGEEVVNLPTSGPEVLELVER